MSIELALLALAVLYAAYLRIEVWLDRRVIQSYQKSAIILPKPEKKRDFSAQAMLLAALALALVLTGNR